MKLIPKEFNRYFEPFIGGGAVFFHLNKKKSYISDINFDLINTYKILSTNFNEIIQKLNEYKLDEKTYYKIRDLDRDENFNKIDLIDRACRFIYINKMCFNGLYRVNSNGYFNVPYCKNENKKLFDNINLSNCANLLKETEIVCDSYLKIKDKIKEKDFIYFDPPYIPLNKTSFTKYTKDDFSLEDHKQLKELCDYINSIGGYFLQSNSYSETTLELYKDYKIVIINANRMIKADGKNRTKAKEVLIYNSYEVMNAKI